MSLTWTLIPHAHTQKLLQLSPPLLSSPLFPFSLNPFLLSFSPSEQRKELLLQTLNTLCYIYILAALIIIKVFSVSAMAVLPHRHHHLSALTCFTFLLFFSSSAATLSQLGNSGLQETEERGKGSELRTTTLINDRFLSQKRLGGPGSSPPTCRSKCGRCSPCKPVHVPIQPGLSMPLEYYPEAWRCKCGNKLFMP